MKTPHDLDPYSVFASKLNHTVIGGLLPGKILRSQRLPLVKH
jgi:hypothetical protein